MSWRHICYDLILVASVYFGKKIIYINIPEYTKTSSRKSKDNISKFSDHFSYENIQKKCRGRRGLYYIYTYSHDAVTHTNTLAIPNTQTQTSKRISIVLDHNLNIE